MYPLRRNRRLRANASIRSLVRENSITPNDFLVPLFVVEGKGIKDEIPSMPNYYRFSLDTLQAEVKLLWSLGLRSWFIGSWFIDSWVLVLGFDSWGLGPEVLGKPVKKCSFLHVFCE